MTKWKKKGKEREKKRRCSSLPRVRVRKPWETAGVFSGSPESGPREPASVHKCSARNKLQRTPREREGRETVFCRSGMCAICPATIAYLHLDELWSQSEGACNSKFFVARVKLSPPVICKFSSKVFFKLRNLLKTAATSTRRWTELCFARRILWSARGKKSDTKEEKPQVTEWGDLLWW